MATRNETIEPEELPGMFESETQEEYAKDTANEWVSRKLAPKKDLAQDWHLPMT